jgi:hypothetical protein
VRREGGGIPASALLMHGFHPKGTLFSTSRSRAGVHLQPTLPASPSLQVDR